MTDRWKAFTILMSLTLAALATVGGLVWLSEWIDSELPNLAEILLGIIIIGISILVAIAILVWMLIFYLSILDAIRSRRKRRNEEPRSVAG